MKNLPVKLQEAIKNISLEAKNNFEDLLNGEEMELNNEYTLYKYTEEDIVVIVQKDEWKEVLQVMTDGESFIFETL